MEGSVSCFQEHLVPCLAWTSGWLFLLQYLYIFNVSSLVLYPYRDVLCCDAGFGGLFGAPLRGQPTPLSVE